MVKALDKAAGQPSLDDASKSLTRSIIKTLAIIAGAFLICLPPNHLRYINRVCEKYRGPTKGLTGSSCQGSPEMARTMAYKSPSVKIGIVPPLFTGQLKNRLRTRGGSCYYWDSQSANGTRSTP